MTMFDRYFGARQSSGDQDYAMPSHQTAKEFGKVDVRRTGAEVHVRFTILMEPEGREAEGWQTGVALDASASMKTWYGRELQGTVPPFLIQEYERKGWVTVRNEDGRRVRVFQRESYEDAIQRGYLRITENIVEPLAREFIAYLAGGLDADGGTTVIYWACDSGSAYEVVGDYTEDQCRNLEISGPQNHAFGLGTHLAPAVRYFVDRFADANRGMYVFLTDGRLDDLDAVKRLTTQLAKEIEAGKRHPIKCVLIGVGNEIDEAQMEQLDNLDTGTAVDIWDHKIAKEMRALVEIFAEVVSENQIVAPTGSIYDAQGNRVWKCTDGVPATVSFSMPATSEWFELEVGGRRIRQSVLLPV
jgi:hypothetical protein